MRIIIEMTEAESRSASVSREVAGQQTAARPAEQEAPAADGGAAPEALLLALGAKTEKPTEGAATSTATDAGRPPSWLLNVTGDRGSAH